MFLPVSYKDNIKASIRSEAVQTGADNDARKIQKLSRSDYSGSFDREGIPTHLNPPINRMIFIIPQFTFFINCKIA